MLHIERIRHDIVALGRRTAQNSESRQGALARAEEWLHAAGAPAELREHLTPLLAAVDADATRWHGCLPCEHDHIDAWVTAEGLPHPGTILIGADGSQIYPDRHALVLYYLIQVGALIFRYDGGTPTPDSREWLRYREEDLFDQQGYLIGPETLGMVRMVWEMQVLADLAARERDDAADEVFALTDGPLLWPYAERTRAASVQFDAYLGALEAVGRAGAIPVGYVDRPGGRPLLGLLWATRLDSDELIARAEDNPLRSRVDEELMVRILLPGEWSPWFTRPTPTNRRHAGQGQEVWFCYANLGSDRGPAIARIEVPGWAAVREETMKGLRSALQHQATALDGYPYVLARAHEEALVTTQDKAYLEDAIQQALLGEGVVARPSDKARQKQLLGRR